MGQLIVDYPMGYTAGNTSTSNLVKRLATFLKDGGNYAQRRMICTYHAYQAIQELNATVNILPDQLKDTIGSNIQLMSDNLKQIISFRQLTPASKIIS